MPNLTLTDACVRALRSRKSVYDIRDAKLRGFGERCYRGQPAPEGPPRQRGRLRSRSGDLWMIDDDLGTACFECLTRRAPLPEPRTLARCIQYFPVNGVNSPLIVS